MFRIRSRGGFLVAAILLLTGGLAPLNAQLPPEAVDLAKVKIAERLKSVDLCPVTLEPSDLDGPTWSYAGVDYRGHGAEAQAVFLEDPDRYAKAAHRERYKQNFMLAMSTIWCPITDEVTPGGRKQVDGLGLKWESCCSFCDEEMREENFTEAVERLEARALEAYELTGGKYTEGASSPVEGAIKEGF